MKQTIKEFKFFLWKIIVLAAHGVNVFFSRTIGTGHCPFSLCRLFIASKDVAAHVIRPLVLLPDFTSSPLTLPIFQSLPNIHTRFQPPTQNYTHFSTLNELSLLSAFSPYKYYQKTIENNRKTIPNRKPKNV